jgi:diadenosine tetraphosphate (Ap4A) HIT family hydrolase
VARNPSHARKTVTDIPEWPPKPAGPTIGRSHGWAGQHVNHLHVRLIPRDAGNGGGGIQSLIRSSAKQDRASIATQIRAATG